MAVNTTWTDPSTGGTIDLATGQGLTEDIYDRILSNLKRMGGTDGDTKTGDMKFGANKVYVNDSANANMTVGLTLNQGANDDEIAAFKSSDVAHGMTDLAETDTYGEAYKVDGATGGMQFVGLSSGSIGARLVGYGVTDNTAKTTAATGYVEILAGKKSGAGQVAPGTDANMVTIRTSAGTTRFIFDVEGSGHADIEWTTYDKYDDLSLIADIEAELLRREDVAQTARRHYLEESGIIGRDSWHFENGKQRAMVNTTKLAMLHHGGIMAVGRAIYAICEELGITDRVRERLGGHNVGMLQLAA